jgi:hypothetical protein
MVEQTCAGSSLSGRVVGAVREPPLYLALRREGGRGRLSRVNLKVESLKSKVQGEG